jgi:hypothetical protein
MRPSFRLPGQTPVNHDPRPRGQRLSTPDRVSRPLGRITELLVENEAWVCLNNG